ncbi:MAG: GNAT family N-acetyltransferase [Thermofilum sp.]|nr:GNAT family N-acetyltransferase [Thermofilum sp.]
MALLGLEVRFATRRDLEEARQILRRSFTGSYRFWSELLLGRLDTLVAVADGKVVGVAEIYTTISRKRGKIGVISFIAVDPEHRGRGVGKRLVLEAERVFREQGCGFSAASTRHDNKASIGMFTKMGYSVHRRGERVFEELEGPLYAYEDDVILVKRLE